MPCTISYPGCAILIYIFINESNNMRRIMIFTTATGILKSNLDKFLEFKRQFNPRQFVIMLNESNNMRRIMFFITATGILKLNLDKFLESKRQFDPLSFGIFIIVLVHYLMHVRSQNLKIEQPPIRGQLQKRLNQTFPGQDMPFKYYLLQSTNPNYLDRFIDHCDAFFTRSYLHRDHSKFADDFCAHLFHRTQNLQWDVRVHRFGIFGHEFHSKNVHCKRAPLIDGLRQLVSDDIAKLHDNPTRAIMSHINNDDPLLADRLLHSICKQPQMLCFHSKSNDAPPVKEHHAHP